MKHGKVDANQSEIVDALLRCGASVVSLTDVGGGVPDLLIGYQGKTLLAEIKTSEGTLNPIQREWHEDWRGQVTILRSIDEALKLIGVIP